MRLPELDDPRRCTARSARTGEPCRKWAIRGGTVCPTHGGSAPAVRNAARRRLERERVDHELGALMVALEDDHADLHPVDVLLESLQRAAAMRDVAGLVVGKLDEDGLYGPDHLGDLRPHPAQTIYREWVVEAARLAKLALDAGIEERRVSMAESAGNRIAVVLQQAVGALFDRMSSLGFDEEWLVRLRRDELPSMIREAITATSVDRGEVER